MATITEAISPAYLKSHLRPFDSRRDLGAVADLVELCFADTLDPEGRDYLRRMREAARSPSILFGPRRLTFTPMSGFVWVEDGAIVGNISLIPYLIQTRRFYLIANVAVHPNHRRRGIARCLTEQAIRFLDERSLPFVWLHVREENLAARNLYQSLGFIERTARTTWTVEPDFSLRENSLELRIVEPPSFTWPRIKEWLQKAYPPDFSWHLPYHLQTLRPGLIGDILRFFMNAYIRQWCILNQGQLAGAVFWQATVSHTNLVWLAAPEMGDSQAIQALLEHLRRHVPTHRTLSLEYPARQNEDAIRAAGFQPQQTLVWMERLLQ